MTTARQNRLSWTAPAAGLMAGALGLTGALGVTGALANPAAPAQPDESAPAAIGAPAGTPPDEAISYLPFADGSFGIYGQDNANTRVELYPCEDDSLCGRIVWLRRMTEDDGSPRVDAENPDPDLRNQPLIGLTVLWDLEKRGEGEWRGGRIYNADDGERYRAHIKFESPEAIELKACLFVVCETQTWTRVAGPEDA